LAKQKVALDKAKQYAESAVTATATTLRNVDLAHAGAPEVQLTSTIASYWDTLGWVYFQQGDLTKAERYIRSAWTVDESGTVGDHLGQILAKQGLKDQAADAYATALATREPGPDARPHLILLLGGNEKIDAMVAKARPELTQQDTFDVGKLVEQKADATFEILLSPAGVDGSSTHVDEVKFIKGSDELRSFGDRLRSINFGTMFPDATPVKLVEIGSLSCTASGDCSFVLMPEDIHTQN
jgi:tetratricopeptide (TPR) repeat protein